MIRQNFVKTAFLELVSILKFPAHRLHVTSQTFARGALRRRSRNDVQSESNPLDSTQSNVNFWGIESEEGVITIGSNRDFPQKKNLKVKSKEQFHRTSFGIIRYDSDNILKYHGQYGKTYDEFPRNSNEYSVVSGNRSEIISNSGQMCNNYEVNTLNNSSTSSKFCENDANVIKQHTIELNNENSGHNSSVKENRNTSYIDQYYFNDSYSDKEQPPVKNISKHPSLPEELSLTGECYNESYNPNDSIKDNQNASYIDKCYFNDSFNENRQSVENSDNLSISEESCFIDQNYFGYQTVSENKLSEDQNIFQNTHFVKEKDPDLNFIRNLRSDDIEDKKLNSLQNHSSSSLKCKNKGDVDQSVFFDQASVNTSDRKHKNNINYIKYITKQLEKKSGMNTKSDVYYLNSRKLPVEENNFKFETSTVKLNCVSSDKVVDSNSHSKTVGSFTSMKDPKDNFKQSDGVGNVTSAYDFVQDLRKQKDIPEPDIKKRSSIFDIKVDSKGFRILKNQVEDLSNYTHDEIFSLLKQNVLYSDDNVLVLNKPYSLVMHESQTTKSPCLSAFLDKLAHEISQQTGDPKLYTVHRLDKETTGCLLLARNETMAQYLKSLFAQRKIIKKYWIVTSRVPELPEGVIDIPIAEGFIGKKKRMVLHPELPKDMGYTNHSKKGKPAVTSYEVISESGNAALIEATPLTGIKHQIRVHFGFGIFCPIIGDHKYSHLDKLAPQKLPSDILQKLHVRQSKVRHIPLHIHAKSIAIPGYSESRDLYVQAPLPSHIKENLRRLKFKK